jgi:hypothetical protein
MIKVRPLSIITIFMLLALTVTGAFATWIYYYEPEPLDQEMESYMGEFAWEPEELLPTESELGKNHLALIELILNENKKGYASTIPLSALSVDSLPGEFSYTIDVDTWRP